MNSFKVGQLVQYTSYGVDKLAKIVRIGDGGRILHLDNGRWMHSISCTVAKGD